MFVFFLICTRKYNIHHCHFMYVTKATEEAPHRPAQGDSEAHHPCAAGLPPPPSSRAVVGGSSPSSALTPKAIHGKFRDSPAERGAGSLGVTVKTEPANQTVGNGRRYCFRVLAQCNYSNSRTGTETSIADRSECPN